MRIRFRPKRAMDFQEVPWWILTHSDSDALILNKNDKPKEQRNDTPRHSEHQDGGSVHG